MNSNKKCMLYPNPEVKVDNTPYSGPPHSIPPFPYDWKKTLDSCKNPECLNALKDMKSYYDAMYLTADYNALQFWMTDTPSLPIKRLRTYCNERFTDPVTSNYCVMNHSHLVNDMSQKEKLAIERTNKRLGNTTAIVEKCISESKPE
jgi:hypothetical protein